MAKFKLFVEGIADVKFLQDYISHIFSKQIKKHEDIVDFTGKDKLIPQQFQINTDAGGVNLLVFDANGNFEKRKKELLAKAKELNIQFELFLFPNNQDKGELENLLEKIINPSNKKIFDCFNEYEKCLSIDKSRFKTPALKTKIFAYVDTLDLKDEGFAKEEKRNYLNKEHWDLEHASLIPLKIFLNRYFPR